jgi:hypothetical protein
MGSLPKRTDRSENTLWLIAPRGTFREVYDKKYAAQVPNEGGSRINLADGSVRGGPSTRDNSYVHNLPVVQRYVVPMAGWGDHRCAYSLKAPKEDEFKIERVHSSAFDFWTDLSGAQRMAIVDFYTRKKTQEEEKRGLKTYSISQVLAGLGFPEATPAQTKSLSQNPCRPIGHDGAGKVEEGDVVWYFFLPPNQESAKTIEP